MAFLQLHSTNPDFSYVIGKNPASGMQIRSVRRGKCFGYFSKNDENMYNLWFKDGDNEISFKKHKDEQFEYLNKTRFNSAHFPISTISSFFNSTLKKQQKQDVADKYSHMCVINLMYIKNTKYVDIFRQHIQGFTISLTEASDSNYQVIVSTNKTIRELLNYINLFCLFNVLKNDVEYFDLSESAIGRYLQCLDVIDPPFLVRYVFKVNLLRDIRKFKAQKEYLEKTSQHDSINFVFGSADDNRLHTIKSRFGPFERNLIDVGCGYGRYALSLAPRLPEDKICVAVDTDPDCVAHVNSKANSRDIENLVAVSNIDEAYGIKDADVLMVEFIEHVTIAEATSIIGKVLREKPKRLIITTPNRMFNKFIYGDPNHKRHETHVFEFDKPELERYISKRLQDYPEYKAEFFDVGDAVDGIHMTQGVVLGRK